MKYSASFSLLMLAAIFSSAHLKPNAVLNNSIKVSSNVLPTAINPDWDAFYKFIAKSIKYPEEAQDINFSGPCQVTFSITDGEVANLTVVKRLGQGCDEEVMKAILSYPNFDTSYDGSYAFVTSFALQGKGRIVTKEEVKPLEGFTNLNHVIIIAYAGRQNKPRKVDELWN